MAKEANLEFRLRKIDETRNLLEEIKHNDLMSENYKKTCKYLNHVENLLIVVPTVTGFSTFVLLVCVPLGITSSAVGLNNCVIIAGIKKYKSIIKKKNKEHDKILVLGKDKLNTTEVLISKALLIHISVMTNLFQ